ncbi:Endolytic murein transglycosylase [bioreactor metagenome]|uniref:Endolytic murein transglycosylase n=1 Tax=bioreactor metagenome TaxID=1076179 RepID=A0A644T7M1_9ZZZZ|nr:endolytic transglycosylase MltG [Candidatus Elulimicrobiales bacterium]
MPKDDFRNFLILKKIEEDKEKGGNFFQSLSQNKFNILGLFLLILFIFFIYNIFFTKVNLQNTISQNNYFQIDNGESVSHIGQRLEEEKVIKSALAFKVYVKLFSRNELVQAGIYQFNKDDTLVSVANKIINSHYAISPVKITLPEGYSNAKLANIISTAFSSVSDKTQLKDDFSEANILSKISDKEGYLFPETYLFLPNVTLDEVIKEMESKSYTNLKKFFSDEKENLHIYALDLNDLKLEDYFIDETQTINLNKRLTIINQVGTTTVSIGDIVKMASYLEGEANNEQDMRMVAGVLWTRLKINYPLQIDAATSTYKEKGFTKTPINNPGMVAIRSTINPINLGYIYYITGNDGKNYYAKDYETHLDNINKYLRNQ